MNSFNSAPTVPDSNDRPSSAQSPALDGSQRPAKRQKVTRACDRCKTRKIRCNGELPCAVCSVAGRAADCSYEAAYTRGKLVQPSQATRTASSSVTSAGLQFASLGNGDPVVSEGSGESDEAQYAGPSSAYAFLKRAWERFGRKQTEAGEAVEEGPERAVSVFSYGDRRLPSAATESNILPEKPRADVLLSTYFDFAMPTYRFLYRPTVEKWLAGLRDHHGAPSNGKGQSPCHRAITWMVLSLSSLFTAATDPDVDISSANADVWQEAERYYQAAKQALAEETGKASLESVQARLATCLYLLHTSRPNEAWYQFGTTVQLAFAVGLHRRSKHARTKVEDAVTLECRKRTFWAMATLDTYLAIMLGRPALIRDDDIDQRYPQAIDDEDLEAGLPGAQGKDSVVQASILHAKVARIVKSAARDQGLAFQKPDGQKLQVAASYNQALSVWQAALPTILSGSIHPSSLVPIFRRQMTVLRLAHAHALMLVNRPLLLIDAEPGAADLSQYLSACLGAAKQTLDFFAGGSAEGTNFAAFWFTQYVAFNAASVVYVWLIQRKRGRLSAVAAPFSDEELLQKAEAVQKHFAAATDLNAPSLRYSVVLMELQQETRRLLGKATGDETRVPQAEASADHTPLEELDLPLLDGFPLDPDLWMQLDSFPYGDYFELPNL